jgi:Gram-negative bacterial TonB protein C-terminal
MNTIKFAVIVFIAASCGSLAAQKSLITPNSESFKACIQPMIGRMTIRVSAGVIRGLVEQKALPDAADLKSVKNADVRVKVRIDESGNVACAMGDDGDTALFERSETAAKAWKFKPYILNGKPVIVESVFYFHFNKGKVVGKFCANC